MSIEAGVKECGRLAAAIVASQTQWQAATSAALAAVIEGESFDAADIVYRAAVGGLVANGDTVTLADPHLLARAIVRLGELGEEKALREAARAALAADHRAELAEAAAAIARLRAQPVGRVVPAYFGPLFERCRDRVGQIEAHQARWRADAEATVERAVAGSDLEAVVAADALLRSGGVALHGDQVSLGGRSDLADAVAGRIQRLRADRDLAASLVAAHGANDEAALAAALIVAGERGKRGGGRGHLPFLFKPHFKFGLVLVLPRPLKLVH
jgi:hypothetical protein